MTARFLTAAVAAVAGALWAAGPAAANSSDALRKEIAALAADIQAVLREDNQTSIAVGDFSGPPHLDAQYGPGIQTLLTEELAKGAKKVDVNRRAEYSVKGDYADAHEENANREKQVFVKITARILKRSGETVGDLTAKIKPVAIRDNTTIAKMTGVTVSLPPAADKAERNNKIQKEIDNPTAPFISGSKIAVNKDSKYAVEVLVKPYPNAPAAPRAASVKEGCAFVNIDKSEIYELRLHNNDPQFDAAASVTIDGVDVFHFAEDRKPDGSPKFSHWIIPAKQATPVIGWFVTATPGAAKNVMRFQVVSIGEGAASKVNAPAGKRGVITVTFAAAATKDHPKDLPADEGPGRSAGGETGFGPGEKVGIKVVERSIGAVREVISIRYNH